jgi:hypothetical protein
MGVYRIRSGSVGRPFRNGNPGGGRPKGTPNKATLEIKAFARNFLMSDRYRRTLKRRILAGTAPHMEVLLHHYAFGKPTDKYVEPAPPAPPDRELRSRMTKEELREMRGLLIRLREIRQAAGARPAAEVHRAGEQQKHGAPSPGGVVEVTQFHCLPDTVDPRAPKGGGR